MGEKKKKQCKYTMDCAIKKSGETISFEMIMDDVLAKRLYNAIVFLDNAVHDATMEIEEGVREHEDPIYLELCDVRERTVDLMEKVIAELVRKHTGKDSDETKS